MTVAEYVRRTTREQGKPEFITDNETIEKVVAIVRPAIEKRRAS